ncbi:hypothetical protein JG688_00017419 [Phytophthora aleatoria]|uniref:RxLR effector protein n=1 Tax=Phytophthora aleatoria TaxID=2496075 RepID=A0A8J5I346_9STRA|nr:hypothetical protein JG688_00017419 [Phytophthora aleatoria]
MPLIMRPYKTLLLALAFLFTLQCHLLASADSLDFASNNQNGIRSLRTAETNGEERGLIDGLRSELSIMKLNWAARQKMSPEDKFIAKKAKELSKLEDNLAKTTGKLNAKVAKAQQKLDEQAIKAEQKLAAKKDKAQQQLEVLQEKEIAKLAKQAAKEDKTYNQWLLANKTPEDIYKKFKFEKLAKKGIDPTTNANFKHYENYLFIYHARYPNLK